MSFKRVQFAPISRVPEPDNLVPATAREKPAVGAERDAVNQVIVSQPTCDFFAGNGFTKLDQPGASADHEVLPVGRECDIPERAKSQPRQR